MNNREYYKELLPIIKAFAEGKQIEVKRKNEWFGIGDELYLSESSSDYRITPKPKYRPFKTQEECWEEMHKHPDFGWVTDGYYKSTISVKSDSIVVTISSLEYDFGKAYIHFTFADGTPFGIKEE